MIDLSQPVDSCQLLHESISLIRLERSNEAEASLRHLLALEPHQLDGTVYLARLLMDRGRHDEAAALLAPAIEMARDRFAAFVPLVAELASRGVEEAGPLLHRIAEKLPNDI